MIIDMKIKKKIIILVNDQIFRYSQMCQASLKSYSDTSSQLSLASLLTRLNHMAPRAKEAAKKRAYNKHCQELEERDRLFHFITRFGSSSTLKSLKLLFYKLSYIPSLIFSIFL